MARLGASTQRNAGIVLSYAYFALQIVMSLSLVYTSAMLLFLWQSEYWLYSLVSSTVAYLSFITLGIGDAYVHFYLCHRVADDEFTDLNDIMMVGWLYILQGKNGLVDNLRMAYFEKLILIFMVRPADVAFALLTWNYGKTMALPVEIDSDEKEYSVA